MLAAAGYLCRVLSVLAIRAAIILPIGSGAITGRMLACVLFVVSHMCSFFLGMKVKKP
jgi:hypothetical protein